MLGGQSCPLTGWPSAKTDRNTTLCNDLRAQTHSWHSLPHYGKQMEGREPAGTILQAPGCLSHLKINGWQLVIHIPLLVFLHLCLCNHAGISYVRWCVGSRTVDVVIEKLAISPQRRIKEDAGYVLEIFKLKKKKKEPFNPVISLRIALVLVYTFLITVEIRHVSFPSSHYPQIDIEMPFNIHLHANTCYRRGKNSCLTGSPVRVSESCHEAWLLHMQQDIYSSPNNEFIRGLRTINTLISQSSLP